LFVAPVLMSMRRHGGEAGTLSARPHGGNEVFVTKKAGVEIWRDARSEFIARRHAEGRATRFCLTACAV
jgi:hypothetical protein